MDCKSTAGYRDKRERDGVRGLEEVGNGMMYIRFLLQKRLYPHAVQPAPMHLSMVHLSPCLLPFFYIEIFIHGVCLVYGTSIVHLAYIDQLLAACSGNFVGQLLAGEGFPGSLDDVHFVS